MLVASLVPAQETAPRQRRAASQFARRQHPGARLREAASSPREAALIAWLVCGMILLICVPAARGSAFFGATLPFWLVGAPLLNLMWLRRQRWWPLIDIRRVLPSAREAPAAMRVRPPRVRDRRRLRPTSARTRG